MSGDVPSSIFADASIISSGRFDSNHYGQYNSEGCDQLGMLVADNIVLSPNEAQMFKKVQKMVLENKNLKMALIENSTRLQEHVNDCIQWKATHKGAEENLKKQLNEEKQKCSQLQSSLDFYTTTMNQSGGGSNLEYQSSTNHIPLIQHLHLKHQNELLLKENLDVKNQLDGQVQMNNQKEEYNQKLVCEKDELQVSSLEKSARITSLLAKIEELENNRSVEVLDLMPQPKEMKQLQANIESYKRTIDTLKERNEELNSDLMETQDSFERVEEENSELKEQLTEVQDELNRMKSGNCGNNLMTDNTGQVLKLEAQVKTLTEELNSLRDRQLVTYELNNDMNSTRERYDELQCKYNENTDECEKLQEELKIQKENFDRKNRVNLNRESKNADRINSLITMNDQLKRECEVLKKDNVELKQHIEQVQKAIDNQSLASVNQSFTDLSLRSKDLMSVDYDMVTDDEENDDKALAQQELVDKLTAENSSLYEEVERMSNTISELEGEKKEYETKIKSAGHSDYVNVGESSSLQHKLNETLSANRSLLDLKKQMETQMSVDRIEIDRLTQGLQAKENSNKDLGNIQDRLIAAEKASEKAKKDHQQMYTSFQVKVKSGKELEEKVNELTSQLVAAKELINSLQEKQITSQELIEGYREKDRQNTVESTQMRDRVEEVEVLRMQLDVYKNDFEAERESREKQQATLEEERERMTQLQLENQRLNEELQKRSDHGVNLIRQIHGQGPPTTMYPNNTASTMMYGQNMNNNQDMNSSGIWQQQQQQQQQQHQQQHQGSQGGWQVYGRGPNETMDPRRSQRIAGGNRMQEDEQRKCPKCHEVLPDLDSLQIHVMECLDE